MNLKMEIIIFVNDAFLTKKSKEKLN